MKRWMKLILPIFLFCSMVSVHADYIAFPDGEFFNDHEGEIDTWGYWHKAEKAIAIVDYPGSDEIVGVIEKDRVIRVFFLYEDSQGVLWGAQDEGIWFKMKHLPKFYANIDFWMEHQEEFKKTYYVPIYFEEDAWLVVWEYPGSDHISGTLPTSVTRDKQFPLYEGAEYTDKNGVRWTSISHMGVSGWLNMEAMLSDTEPEVKSIFLTLDENFDIADYPELEMSFLEMHAKEILISTLVIGVCVFTGVLFVLKKKKVRKC